MSRHKRTTRPFRDELPELLDERGITLRALAEAVGGFDHGYLSRMLNGQRAVNPTHAAHIASYLDLPQDYFPEVREARLIDAVRSNAVLRDEVYDLVLPKRRRRARKV
jgi:transcriptional regulator with XRE-family HTH domain